MKQWVDGLHLVHPHTKKQKLWPNVHASLHLYDFLLLFGPVISWWCFPFERLIGTLQKIKTNHYIGGALEGTLLKSHMRGANLQRWLKRPECPKIIWQFKHIFDKFFSPANYRDEDFSSDTMSSQHSVVHNSVNFTRCSTHLGNSLVLYYPSSSSLTPIAGSIQMIDTLNNQVYFFIQRHQPLLP
ncbi:hypothetical protein L208DRAFT_1260918, partial [Tricholoma matsutake]